MDTCPDTSAPETETDPTTYEGEPDTRQPVTSIIAIVLLAALGAAYLMRVWFHTADQLSTVSEDLYAFEIAGFLTRGFIPVAVGFLCAIVLFFGKEAARVGVLAVSGALLFSEVNSLPTNFTNVLLPMGTGQPGYLMVDLVIVAFAIAVSVLLTLGPVSRWLRAQRKTRRPYPDSDTHSTIDSTPEIRPGWIIIVAILLGLIALTQIIYFAIWTATSTNGMAPASIGIFTVSQIVIILSIVVSAFLTYLGVAGGRTLAIAVSGNAILVSLALLGTFLTVPADDPNPTDLAIQGSLAAANTLSAAAGIVTLVLLSGRQCVDWFYVKKSSEPEAEAEPIPAQTSTPS
ncbi:MAG TPA: hypothetical protein H9902_08595 [Candidatus Stackebrandtia faecavium]|nr:hypothetical protein [Candidatus Stackebrandtia faecavium]